MLVKLLMTQKDITVTPMQSIVEAEQMLSAN